MPDLLNFLALEALDLVEAMTPHIAAPARYSSPIEELLAGAMEQGTRALLAVVRPAVARLLSDPLRLGHRILFTEEERKRLFSELTALVTTSNLLGRSLLADHGQRIRRRKQPRVREARSSALDVPVRLQDRDWTCGAACLRAVLDYHGIELTEPQTARLLGTTPQGTSPSAMETVASELGLAFQAKTGATLADLRWALWHNAPVCCDLQMHGNGHWIVVVGIADESKGSAITLMDPLSGMVTVNSRDFLRHWWDVGSGRRWERYALAIGAPVHESRLHMQLSEGLGPLQPVQALDFFRALLPFLGTDPMRLLPDFRRHAFTLCVATEIELLRKVQGVIAERLANGDTTTGSAAVQAVLDAAGVSARNSGYAEMVFRTNAMDSYNQGLQDQMREEIDTFPVWRYSNPHDNRSRKTHAEKNGLYYPTSVPFTVIRGTGIEDVAQCRCTPVPIDRWNWAHLRRRGARIADGYQDPISLLAV
jgi:predicted double-glycine peptidase